MTGNGPGSESRRQVEYLLGQVVPKTSLSDGAIPHRLSQLQLWQVSRASVAAERPSNRTPLRTGVTLCTWCPRS